MMPRGLKYTLSLLPLFMLAACVAVGEKHLLRHREPMHVCSSVEVRYIEKDPDCLPEVNPDEIDDRIRAAAGTVLGKRFQEISLDTIEKSLCESSVISGAQAYLTNDGTLHLDLKRRMPLMWLQDGEKGWLVDETGYGFNLSGWDGSSLPRVDGPFSSAPGLASEMVSWMEEMKKYGIWELAPHDISVEANGDISFTLEERNERVLFGDLENFGDKVSRLKLYYSSVLPSLEEGRAYGSIDLKYDRQIVCR